MADDFKPADMLTIHRERVRQCRSDMQSSGFSTPRQPRGFRAPRTSRASRAVFKKPDDEIIKSPDIKIPEESPVIAPVPKDKNVRP